MRVLPEFSLHQRMSRGEIDQVARWATKTVRLPPHLEDEAMQEIEWALRRHRISPETKQSDIGKLARTTAKRWALDVKRKLAYPVTLRDKDFFDKEARDACVRSDDEFLNSDMYHQDHVEGSQQLNGIDPDAVPNDDIQWSEIPDYLKKVIDDIWWELKPGVANFFRHVLAGESVERASQLECIAIGTGQGHYRTVMQTAQARLESAS